MSRRLYVATRKGVFTLEPASNGSSGWKIAAVGLLGVPVSIVMPDPRDGRIYAAAGHGHFGVKLHRSEDHGRSWPEVASPKYPPRPEDQEPDMCPMRGIPVPWNTELIWSLEPGGADRPEELWCGTLPGGLFHSPDAGQSWTLNRSLWDHPSRRKWFGGGMDWPGIHSISVDSRDSGRLALGVSCGGIWLTDDAGQSWTQGGYGMKAEYMPPEQAENPETQDPHYCVRCPGSPDVMWVQHHCGIYRSTDAGMNWTQITAAQPSAFGFAVAAHPNDPLTAWFVPAVKDEARYPVDGQVVVSRTRDGGESFEVLRHGLPQEHAYDITFRHALDVATDGNMLAFGSTTGSLWISSDAGDRWQQLSAHLPPVYCVRFAD